MSDTVITVENLSKSYLVGHQSVQREKYASLRDAMARGARNFGRKFVDLARGRQIIQGDEIEEFWALKDVNFRINRGEVVGIIGRNGAGKSTLLKILSRITEPSRGRITIVGRLASLLEVGTGFHPELTGRENIYLNGAILGMTRAEIDRKFDEITAFAEIERFLDTPVKRYSSGMYVRLAFAVAAHLEPEVLVVDEVLAVGDVEFQAKCLGKMEEVAGRGRTVLMVSHNTHAIRALCKSTITLKSGRLLFFGDTDKAIQVYDGSFSSDSAVSRISLEDKPRELTRDPRIKLIAINLEREKAATFGLPYNIDIDVHVSEAISSVVFGVGFCSRTGARILSSDSDYSGCPLFNFVPGKYRINCAFNSFPLAPGEYLLDVGCRSSGLVLYDEIKGAYLLEVLPPINAPPQFLQRFSTCMAKSKWETRNGDLTSS